ncbi:MAG: Na/Pi cotransporter family protein, partial [Lachnospiraceae bacterium]|nr:Na/Pi cotransporter family protein [Candidatus Equihabitans merdae]
DNKLLGLIFGAVITIAIQSSSAMTVMLVGFVNSGIMNLGQTISVIMGSDVGTTLTAWILSLSGIDSSNALIQLLKPQYLAPIVALIGILLNMISKKESRKNVGAMLLGLSILLTGMTMMSSSMSPLKDMPEFSEILTAFTNPLLGVLVGTVLTAIVQSSAATVGILQALSLTGQITYGMAIPIVMGENIGTCMTAILSAIGVNRKAKKVAVIHVSIKVIGTILGLIVFYIVDYGIQAAFLVNKTSPVAIAIIHTVFNIAMVAVTFPFQKQLEALANRLLPDKEEDQEIFLDERLLITPSVALGECHRAMMDMTEMAEKSLDVATDLFYNFDEEDLVFLAKNEERIDRSEDQIGKYLMKLTSKHNNLSVADSLRSSRILHGINEFERLADLASYMASSFEEIHTKEIEFSPQAKVELEVLLQAVREVYNYAIESFREADEEKARRCDPLQNIVKLLCDEYKVNHVNRVQEGICGAEQGFVFNDILTDCERISDHSMNIAATVIRTGGKSAGERGYMHDIKSHTSESYRELYNHYYDKYVKRIDME